MDSNLPPETWITAAPQDTLTTRDEFGGLIPPQPGTIPFRYHLYWSGSDHDGRVTGFYWAVTETTGSVSGLPIPPLPGPKPQDYHYTSVTDSVFIFNVLEETNNRQHAFFIYAVDDKGKPDATPARLIFNTLDRFPPIPVIDPESRAEGLIFRPDMAWNGAGPIPTPIETTVALVDTFSRRSVVKDYVPMGAVIRLFWHSEMTTVNNPAVAYKYKIGEGDEVEFVTVPASVTGTTYNTTDRNRLGPGLKIFTLRAIDQAGGARTSPETTRRFYMNLTPDTWFAGPNPNDPIYTTESYANGQVKKRYYQTGSGSSAVWTRAMPGSYLGPDSVQTMPAHRIARKTFFEIFTEYDVDASGTRRHRIYPHAEGDTVHLNSWIVLHGGGFDPDSPYSLRVLLPHPALPGFGSTPVLTSGAPNGSPVGHRFRVPVLIDSIGPLRPPGSGRRSEFTQSQVYPLVDPAFVPEPHIAGFQGMQQSGRAYAILRSQDGNGGRDERIEDPIAFVDSIEQGLIPPSHPRYSLRDKVLTFFVNRAPYLLRDIPTFEPRPCTPADPTGCIYFDRRINLSLHLVRDDDPRAAGAGREVGGIPASANPDFVYRFSVMIRGRRTGSNPPRDTVFVPPGLAREAGRNQFTPVDIPSFLQGPDLSVEIEVCDCRDCETSPGQGRCRRYPPINVIIPQLSPQEIAAEAAALAGPNSATRPGSTAATSRSRTP